jgi:hypothetical protein
MAKRVFKYADRNGWLLMIVAFVAAVAAGTLLPLMDLIFGKFVTTFTGFATGTITPAQYRSEVNKLTYVAQVPGCYENDVDCAYAACISYTFSLPSSVWYIYIL